MSTQCFKLDLIFSIISNHPPLTPPPIYIRLNLKSISFLYISPQSKCISALSQQIIFISYTHHVTSFHHHHHHHRKKKEKNENELISFFSSSIDLFSSSSFFHIKLRTTKKANKQQEKSPKGRFNIHEIIFPKKKRRKLFSFNI